MEKQLVRKIARLARLALTPEQEDLATTQLSNTLKWIEQLQAVNTDGVEPLASVADIHLPLRKDVVNDGNCAEAVLANAPEQAQGYFVVPKVVE
ncbi:MAG: Asp-tRNA(Asn)/Glu-tRNA(Gln) amidotransferase subunit GatC [Alphaproteobacteria bacterium]|nr:Asp-tRNA(Asn)/Glu-tRNA(Gln) amidotransferase subunit GatC [Alphaproteobacteria bacterium]